MNSLKTGNYIALKRKEAGITQKELAEKLMISDKAVSRWETGKYMPDLDTIPVLCDELGITVNELLCGKQLDEHYKEQADENLMDVFAANKSINKRKLLCDILAGAGAGIILGVVYAPDTTKKAICVGFGLALLCAGWLLRYKLDQAVIGR